MPLTSGFRCVPIRRVGFAERQHPKIRDEMKYHHRWRRGIAVRPLEWSGGAPFYGAGAAGAARTGQTFQDGFRMDHRTRCRGMGRRAFFGALAFVLAATGPVVCRAHAEDSGGRPSIWERHRLGGDWGGARTALHDKGVDLTLDYTAETFAVLSGGLARRLSYEGRLEVSADADLRKSVGWTGGSAHVTVFQIHDGGHTVEDGVGAIADPSGIDALATTRLFTAWFEQSLLDDRVSVRIGELAADDEFFTSDTAAGLINATFGWPTVTAADMTSGGPAYPLSAPAVRVKLRPTDDLTVIAAAFSGDPAGGGCEEGPQQCDRHGTTFSVSGGTLWMGELHYALHQGKGAAGLPGTYKLGTWYATADFADQHLGVDAAGRVVSLADPAAAGPLDHSGNWGIYAIVDQTVWRAGKRSLALFARGGVSPSDRNLVSDYVDVGAGFAGLFPGRDGDVLTFGLAYSGISGAAAAFDRDVRAVQGPQYPIRDYEMVLELSYAAQIAPWWTVQPDLQYIVHPGGNVPGPHDSAGAVSDAFLAGVRSTIRF